VVQESEYDGLGRRIVKAVQNSAGLDATYHYYYSGHSIVEVRNGSDATLKQYVWGRTYIDELVQTSINDDPADGTEQDCETQYFAMQDANYNVLGIVDASGNLKERYEYTPYGERTVYYSPGPNDPKAMAPTSMSRRVDIDGTLQPYGINEFGHQGLFHDEETGLVYQRARIWNPPLGRFNQPDPLGYPDGMNRFAGYHVLHGGLDPSGLVRPDEFWHQWSQAERQAWFQNFHKELGGMIADSARRNCVPQELLANHGLWAGYLDGILSPQSPYNNPPIGR
jgi:RHS repeat-associated protein